MLFLAAFTTALLSPISTRPATAADDKAPLILENGGLKSVYRVVFHEWDDKNNFAAGAFEIQGHESEEPELRVPFAVELKPAKDKKTELLEVRCTAGFHFFGPADKKVPYPLLTWTLTGRKAGKPVLKAKLWNYNSEKSAWVLEEMTFEKPQQ